MTENPRTIGKYEVLGLIARGGMAEVYLCRTTGDGGFEKLLAVKRIHPHLADDRQFVEMFMDEARISAGLQHSNIGQIFELGRCGASRFIAMEYIQGLSLKALFRLFQQRATDQQQPASAHVVASVCSALDYAHNKHDSHDRPLQIIHRDVSPTNVLITFEGEVKLIDFGIAKATQRMRDTGSSTIKGKFSYMAPEQVSAGQLDHRVDLFSAGILLFELITGTRLFEAETDLGVMYKVRKAEIPRPGALVQGLPDELDRICQRALARDPAQRFQTAAQMQGELERFCFQRGFGRQQLGQLMQQAFGQQLAGRRRFLRQARQEYEARFDAAATNELTPAQVQRLGTIPTLDVDPDDILASESTDDPAATRARTPSTPSMASGEQPTGIVFGDYKVDTPAMAPVARGRKGVAAVAAVVGLGALALALVVYVVSDDPAPQSQPGVAARGKLMADQGGGPVGQPLSTAAKPGARRGWTCAAGGAPCLMEHPVSFAAWRGVATKAELAWDTGTDAAALAIYLPRAVCQAHCQRLGFRLASKQELSRVVAAAVPGSTDPLYEWSSTSGSEGQWQVCAGQDCRLQAGDQRRTDIGFRCASDSPVLAPR